MIHKDLDLEAYKLYCETRNAIDDNYSALCSFDYFIYKKHDFIYYYNQNIKYLRKEKLKKLYKDYENKRL